MLSEVGSFGPGVYSDFDIRLTYGVDGTGQPSWARLFIARDSHTMNLNVTNGVWTHGESAIRSMTFRLADGTAVTAFTEAESAEIRLHTGTIWRFEVIPGRNYARLSAIEDRNGNAITIAYQMLRTATPLESSGIPYSMFRIATVTDAFARVATFTYTTTRVAGAFVVSSIALPGNRTVSYTYGGNGLVGLSGVALPDGSAAVFSSAYDSTSQLQALTMNDPGDPEGHGLNTIYVTTSSYVNSQGLTVSRPANRIRLATQGDGGELSYANWYAVDPNGQSYRYVYEGTGRLRRFGIPTNSIITSEDVATSFDLATDPATWQWKPVSRITVDSKRRATSKTDATGRKSSITYDDAVSWKNSETKPDGTTQTWAYNDFRQQVRTQDELGRVEVRTYDSHGNQLTHRVGLLAVAGSADDDSQAVTVGTWSYNARGQVVQAIDANGRITDYTYDAQGFLTGMREPTDVVGAPESDRATWTYAYDATGRMSQVTTPVNQTVVYAYDARNRVVQTSYSDNSSDQTIYGSGSASALVAARIDRNGVRTDYTYDSAGRETQRIEAVGTPVAVATTTTYVPGTRRVASVNRHGTTTTYAYDGDNRRISDTSHPVVGRALTSQTVYDPAGRALLAIDPYGRQTGFVYDTLGRVVRTVRELVPGAALSPDPANLPFLARDIGAATPGSTTVVNGVITLLGYGLNVWSTSDQFHYYARPLGGDGSLTVRVDQRSANNSWPQSAGRVGVMLRTSDATNAPNLYVYLHSTGVKVQYRAAIGAGTSVTTAVPPSAPPVWLRITHQGGLRTCTASMSTDGTTWTDLQTVSLEGPNDNPQIGLAVNSCSNGFAMTGVFSNLSVTTTASTDATLYAQGLTSVMRSLSRPTTANPGYVIEDTTYDAAGQVLSRTDGSGTVASFTYDRQGRMLSQTEDVNGAPATTSFTYDAARNRLTVTSPRGVVTRTSYTGRNLPYQVTEADGTLDAALVSTTTYSPTRKPLTVTDALGRTTVYTYGTCCDRLVGITDPAGFASGFTYDHLGNRLTVLDPNGLITTTTYDARRRVATATNAAGETTAYAYDDSLIDGVGIDAVSAVASVLPSLGLGTGSAGSAVAVTDPSGATTYDLRDALGRSVARIDALGHATIIAYDTLVGGLVETAMTDALGHTTRSRSDGANRVRQQVDALGNIATASYDADGNQLAQRDATNVGWNASYDSRNRLTARSDTRTTGGGSTSWTYDLDGNRLSETDALGHTETSTYDPRNRRVTLTDRLGGITRFAYDAVGNLVQIADADNTAGLANLASSTQYAYDARNLLIAEAFPTGQTGRTLRVYAYDAGRRLTGRNVGILSGAFGTTPAFAGTAEVTTYAYDNANRLTIRGYADGRNDTFTYDQTGRLLTATSARYGSNTVVRGYDAAGRLLNEALTLPGGTLAGTTVGNAVYTVGYAYDAANRLTSLTYPDGQGTVTRGYTDRNELASVAFGGGSIATRAYDAGGRLLTTTFGNGAVETRGYVPGDNLVASLATASGGTALVGFGYTYDADKRKLTETDQVASQTQAFGYDHASRLTSWNRTGVTPSTQSWNLSLVGDWTSTTRDGVAEPRVNTAVHEAVQVGSNLLTYDAKGNLTRDEHQTGLSWDPENRLISARVTPDASDSGFGAVASYRYDALGRRIAKTVNGVTTVFINAGAQTVVELVRPAIPSQASINGAESDGTLTNAALPPASGGILPGSGVTRVNFQPSTTAVPAGFLADTGKISAVRTNGMTYGWSSDATSQAVVRHGAVPLVEFDTFVQAQPDAGGAASWSIALPNGSYPVVVVAGDALSRNQTNNLVVGGANTTDTTPAAMDTGYEAGNFDGYAVQANVTDGVLTITPGSGAYHAKLCFVEIGVIGTAIDTATQDRLAALIAKANAQTGANPEPQTATKTFVYGAYVDEVVAYTVGSGASTSRYYVHSNHLWSPAAITDSSGNVVERMNYDAYGRVTITSAGNVVRSKSAVGFDRGFTGQIRDDETGLNYDRERMYSPSLGRFVSRDPWRSTVQNDGIGLIYRPYPPDGYPQMAFNMYGAPFVPNSVDPTGMFPGCSFGECDTGGYCLRGGFPGDCVWRPRLGGGRDCGCQPNADYVVKPLIVVCLCLAVGITIWACPPAAPAAARAACAAAGALGVLSVTPSPTPPPSQGTPQRCNSPGPI